MPIRIFWNRAIAMVILSLLGALVPTAVWAQAVIEAELDDSIVQDRDADGEADRGDELGYSLKIRNTGDGVAESVEVMLPVDGGLVLDPDSIMVGPIALDDSGRVAPSASLSIPVLANDRDIDGTLVPQSLSLSSAPTLGNVVIDGDAGAFTYTAPATPGTDTFRYTVADDDGMVSREALVTVVVNSCPVARNDAATIAVDGVLAGNVLSDNGAGADTDGDSGDTLTVSAVNGVALDVGVEITLGSGALLTVNGDGSYRYDPNGAFEALATDEEATDSFIYTITDELCEASATVTLTITGRNNCPVAANDSFRVLESATLVGDLLADNGGGADSDVDTSNVLSIEAVNGAGGSVGGAITLPSGALLNVNSNGTFSYDPNGIFDGLTTGESDTDTFAYTVSDGTCPDSATVTITVDGENDCPTVFDDGVSTNEDSVVNGNVLADNGNGADGDVDTNDSLTVTAVNGLTGNVGVEFALSSGALLTLNADGTFAFNPNGAFENLGVGESYFDQFTYTLSDGTCDTDGTVTVTVNGLNGCPVAQADSVTTDEDSTLNGNVLADNGNGADSDEDTSNTLSIDAVNGSAVSIGTEITLASGALLTLNGDGTFAYNPNGAFEALGDGENDSDSFSYSLTDGTCSVGGAVTVTITGVNDCPVARDDSVGTDEDTLLNGDVLADNGGGADGDSDASDSISVTAVNGSGANVGAQFALASGALLTLNANGTFAYVPNGAFESLATGEDDVDTFTYTLSDGTCSDDATVTVTLDGVNDCPVANDDSVLTDESTTLNGDLKADNGSGADSDDDGSDTTSVSAVNGVPGNVGTPISLASGALLTVNANGTFSYNPNGAFDSLALGQDDTDSFTYTLSDGTCGDDGTVTVTVNGLNTCPVAENDGLSTDEDSVLNGDVKADNGGGVDSDVDAGSSTTVSAVNGSGANVGVQIALASGALLTVNANGTFSYDPNGQFEALGASQTDNDSFTYTLSDGTCTDDGTVSITINGVNDAPVASAQSTSAFGNIQLVGNTGSLSASASGSASRTVATNLLASATDVDTASGSLSVVAATGATGQGGGFQVFADGSFTYAPPTGFTGGNDTFSYTITDGAATSASATVTIAVSDLVWFIDNTGGGTGGSGTSTSPFKTIGAFNTANGTGAGAPATGEKIYLLNGDSAYTTGITLLDNQILEGEGVALVVSSETLVSAGAAPVVGSTTTHGISLAQNNTLRGVTVSNTPGFFKVSGTAVGNLTVSGVSLTGTGGALQVTTSGAFGSNVTFSTLESTSSPGAGLSLTSVTGTLGVSAPGTGISGSADGSPAVEIVGGTVSLTYTGAVSKSNNGALVSVSGGHGTGTVQFSTGALSATGGTGLQFDNADGTYNFNGTSTLAGGDAGIDIVNGSAGNFTFTNAPITNPSGTAFRVNGGSGVISHGGTIAKSSAGLTVDVQSRSGGSIGLSGQIQANSGAGGIQLQNNTAGTVTFSGTQKTLATGASTALSLNNNSGATFNFTNGGLDIDTTAAAGIVSSTGGTLNISGSSNTVDAVGSLALDIDATSLGITLASLSASFSTTGGIDLSNIPASSTVTVTGTTSVLSPSGICINIDDVESGSTLTFGNVTLTNRATDGIRIQDHDGASITFADVDIPNALAAGGNGVTVQSTGAATTGAITFASLDISNTNATVGRNDGGGDGIPDNETDDGHGIRLRDHTGGFTITGAGAQGNGGTIEMIEGDGISMIRSGGLDIDGVTINNIGTTNQTAPTVDNGGIFALNVVGSNHVKDSTISRFQDGNSAGGNSRGIYITNAGTSFTEFRVTDTTFFNDNFLLGEDGIFLTTSGAVSGALVVESLFTQAHGSNRSEFHTLSGMAVQVVQNGSGTLTTNISNSTFRDAITVGGLGGIDLSSVGSGTMSNMVTGSYFQRLCPDGVNNGGVVTLFASGTANYDATVDNCEFGNAGQPTSTGRGAIRAATGDQFTDTPSDFDITISNNIIDNTDREAISLFLQGGAVPSGSGNEIDISVTNNVLGAARAVATSGREGVEFRALDNAKTVNLLFQGNQVRNLANSTSDETVDIDVEDSATVKLQVLGNTLTLDGTSTSNPNSIEITTEDVVATVCLDMNSANVGANFNTVDDGILLTESAGSFSIEDIGGFSLSSGAVQTFVGARNTGTVSASGTFDSCNEF